MSIRRAALSLILVSALYVALLAWVDGRRNVFAHIPTLAGLLPTLMALAVLSWLARFARWQWLLRRAGKPVATGRGLLAYVAGFAFTATPGKVGELIRIRYLAPMGVPPRLTISAFVFERAFDLIVALMIASLAVSHLEMFTSIAVFVVIAVSSVILVARNPGWVTRCAAKLDRCDFRRAAAAVHAIGNGVRDAAIWMTPRDVVVAGTLGAVAWLLQACAFDWLLGRLGQTLPWNLGLAIYPAALLAGAASLLPGGLGSTEAVIVALLVNVGAPMESAILAAVGIRLSTLWFAIVCGLTALVILERRNPERCASRRQA